jgi:hypothetical protein
MRVNIESTTHIANGPKRAQKIKWNKNPPKDKWTPMKKKPWDVTKVLQS